MKTRPRRRLALLVDDRGAITTLHDPAGLVSPGVTRLDALVDSGGHPKLLNFLSELTSQGAAHAWEMPVVHDGRFVTLSFSASRESDGSLLVLACARGDALPAVIDDTLAAQPDRSADLRARLALLAPYQPRRSPEADAPDPVEGLAEVNRQLVSMHRELARRNQDLEQLQKEKNELLGMVVHDLRGPLSSLIGAADLIEVLLPKPHDKQVDALLSLMQDTHLHMVGVIDALLDLSALEAGRLQIQLETTNLSQLLHECLKLQRLGANAKSIELCDEITADLSVRADPRRLRQVIDNLVSNAIKFSKPGSRVVIGAGTDPGGAWFEVADQGPGVPEAEQATIFTPFARGSVKATAGERSTGLGLAISRRVMEAHGGRLDLDSASGRGSRFRAWLPSEPKS